MKLKYLWVAAFLFWVVAGEFQRIGSDTERVSIEGKAGSRSQGLRVSCQP